MSLLSISMSSPPGAGRARGAAPAFSSLVASLVLVLCVSACGGGGGDNTASAVASAAGGAASSASGAASAATAGAAASTHATATSIASEPAGKNCPSGGSKIGAGLDLNDNGTLEAAEATTTQYVCNGSSGVAGLSALVRVAAEPAGTHCAQGGSLVTAGVDRNANNALDAAEVTSTSYVCNGSGGAATARAHNSLLVATAEAAGPNCPYAGTKMSAGLDANDSGVLDAAEITSTSYSCNGAPGAAGSGGGSSGSSGTGTPWISVTATAVTMARNTGYLANNAAQVVLTLPAAPTVGDVFSVLGQGTGGWKIAQSAGQSIVVRGLPNSLAAGSVWTARETSRDWSALASSSDGNRLLAAVYNGQLFTSTDAGLGWTARQSARSWKAVASSADGVRLVAAAANDTLYVSADAGATWTPRDAVRNWTAVASSADGTRLVATEGGGRVYTSADSGATWTAQASAGPWVAVASSADGQSLVAAATGQPLSTSNDGGATWTARDSARNWVAVAASADGTKLVAAVQGGQLYTSTDAGAGWTPRANSSNWNSVASSADGARLVAAAFNDTLYTSADSGASWTPRETTRAWYAVASSADGSRLLAAEFGGSLYTSVNERTSVGTAGSLSGGQYDAVGLIYLGSGLFAVHDFTSYSGRFGGS